MSINLRNFHPAFPQRYFPCGKSFFIVSVPATRLSTQLPVWWAYLDLNQDQSPYQGRAPTKSRLFHTASYLVGVLGFEPRTSSLSGTRSNQLSYTPGFPQKLTLLSATGLGIPLRGSRQFSGAPRSGIPLASQCSYLRFDAALGHRVASRSGRSSGAEGARTLNILLAKQVL